MIAVGAEITTIRVDNTTASAQTNVPFTFGQVFAAGDLPAVGAAVELRAPDNSVVPCQLDAKVNHADGSLRHGILSAIIPALAASASVTYSIVRKAAPAAGAAPVPADFAGLTATVLLTDTGTDLTGPNAGTAYTADAAARLAAGTYETWLSGPIVSEWLVRAPLLTSDGVEHPDLHVRFNIRAYAGQAKAKIDYIVENNWAKPKTVPSGTSPWEDVSIAPRIYAFSLKAGSTTVHTRAVNGHTRTRLTFNSGGVYDGNATGLPNDATNYTATITVDGVAKPISITGSAAQTYGQLRAQFNAQLGGAATCSADVGMLGLIFKSTTTGPLSSVVISYGTLFPALSHPVPYRPIRGDEVIHYPATRWKKTFWWGAAPSVHVAHNKIDLMATMATPNYPPDLTGDPATIAANLATMLGNEDIGDNGLTKAYMGDVGYAPGIGILPEWAALYLANQGADAKYLLLKQADLMGSWPIHARDYGTDLPLNFEQWPYATYSVNASDSGNPATGLNEKLPVLTIPAAIPANRNRPDTAHHPDFCFLPYLVTGDHYYMEGMLFYQRYLGLNTNAHASYRQGRKCLWKTDQPRGQAWSLRTTVHTLYACPDGHPLRSDVAYSLAQNVLWYGDNYVAPTGVYHNPFGFIYHGSSGLAYSTTGGGAGTGGSTFMDDFITAACGRAVELGFTELMPLLSFKAKCVAGRLTSGTDFCWQLAANSTPLRLKAAAADTVLYATWNQVYLGSYDSSITSAACGSVEMGAALTAKAGYAVPQNGMMGYASTIGGYPSNMQPAVAYCATYATSGGADSWMVFEGRAQKPDYNLGPQFAVVPRAAIMESVMTAPPDIYTVASGQKIYGGRSAPAATAMMLNDVDKNQRVFQHVDGVSAIPVSGTTNGSAPVQACAVHPDTGAVLVGWTTIDSAPSGGAFAGSLPVSAGHAWYLLKVRDSVNQAVTATGVNRFAAGANWILGGQSNTVNMPETPYHYPTGGKSSIQLRLKNGARTFVRIGNKNDAFPPNTRRLTYVAGGYDTFTKDLDAQVGDAFVYIANVLSAQLGMVVCLAECATGGKEISYWTEGTKAGWPNVTAAIAELRDVEGAIWYQGESDFNTDYDTYIARLGTLHSQLHQATGRNASNFKFGIVATGAVSFDSSYAGASDTKTGKTRSAQIQYAHNTPGAFLAATNHDCETSDGVHVTKESYASLGPRIALTIAAQYGIGPSGAGPRATGAARAGADITLNVQHAGGTSLLDGAGGSGGALTGFRVFLATDTAKASPLAIASTGITSANTIRVTLAADPAAAVVIDYAMTNAPHSPDPITSQVDPAYASCAYDNVALVNSARGCPLQPFAGITVN